MITRTLSAVVLVPPLLWLLMVGPPSLLFLLALLVVALLIREWHGLREPFSWRRFLPLLLGVWVIVAGHMPGAFPGSIELLGGGGEEGGAWYPDAFRVSGAVVYVFLLLGFFVEGLWVYRPGRPVFQEISGRFFGVVYCAVPPALLVDIRGFERGGILLLFLMLTIWATDVGAYFVGRAWGRRKLAPSISPGKTWAGFWGGIVFACAVGFGMAWVVALPFDGERAVLFSGLLSVVGQVGDLAESLVKREAGVKDSGRLIPGHGGLLDRLDSLLFAAPVFYVLLMFQS